MKTNHPIVIGGLWMVISCAEKPSDTALATDSGDPCADVPVVNYDNFGQGFMSLYCEGCHGSEAEDRHGAPESVTFGSVTEVWAHSAQVLALAADVEAPTMPPGGGVPADERIKLYWWLSCATEGT